jgi:hypothetical protein
VLFLSREAQVTKAAAERLADVFSALFDPKRPPHVDRAQLMGDAADGAPIPVGLGGNRPRDGDEIQRGSNGPAAAVDDLSALLERFASKLEQRDAVAGAVAPQQQRQEQAATAVAAAFQPPTLMGTALQQMRALPAPAGSSNLLAQLKAAEVRNSERESEQSRQRLAATLAGALAAQFDRDEDDDEFA